MRGDRGVRILVLAIAAVVLGLVVSACTPDGEAAGSSVSSSEVVPSVTVPVATTTTAAATTTVVEPSTSIDSTTTTTVSEIPFPDTTGEDWKRIVTEIVAFIGWLYENPMPELLERVAVPGSPYFERNIETYREYEAKGWRDLPGGRASVVVVALAAGDPASGSVILRVASEYDGATTVDGDDQVVREDPGREPLVRTWVLEGSREEGWRIVDLSTVGPYEGGAE